MDEGKFNALMLRQEDGKTIASVEPISLSDLPEGEVVIDVAYSSLNYKDALAVTGRGKIVRKFPFIPGIDVTGTVRESASPSFKAGDPILLTNWGVGERFFGGYSQKMRAKADWLLPLPTALTPLQAMTLGTAGLTAMLCVAALEDHGLTLAAKRNVLVTGATGGVGSIAVCILAKLGYQVTAVTGRMDRAPFLKSLGAAEVIPRSELTSSNKPLQSERWAGAVDTVGGATLAGLLSSMAYESSVAACGLAGGSDLPTTVFPFILRGVNLLGIDCCYVPNEKRTRIWNRLAGLVDLTKPELQPTVIGLNEVPAFAEDLLDSKLQGRIVVDVNAATVAR